MCVGGPGRGFDLFLTCPANGVADVFSHGTVEEKHVLLDDAQQAFLSEDETLSAQLAEWIASTKLRHPLRARQWVKEYDSWKELRNGALSIEAINRSVYEMLSEA